MHEHNSELAIARSKNGKVVCSFHCRFTLSSSSFIRWDIHGLDFRSWVRIRELLEGVLLALFEETWVAHDSQGGWWCHW